MDEITVRAPAKINLGLSVGPPGADGYHELVNVFHAVSLFDEVTARRASVWSVSVVDQTGTSTVAGGAGSGARAASEVDTAMAARSANSESARADDSAWVPLGEDNLALRAARLLAGRTGVSGGVELRIRKSIPVAGGMAGGSADAAAALVACDALWNLGSTRQQLLDLGGRLGADVSFPLVGGNAVGLGRGERLTPITSEGSLHWIFALPTGGLSAAAVYEECDRLRAEAGVRACDPREPRELRAALRTGDPEAVGAALHNDLEAAAVSLRPDLGHTLDAGTRLGALGALVSGSGPTCAFLASSARHARELGESLQAAGVCRATVVGYGPVPGAQIVTDSNPAPAAHR